MGMTIEDSIGKPYRFIILSEDIEEVKKMRKYNNQVIPDKSTAIAVDTNEQFIFQDGKWIKVIKDGMSIDEALNLLNNSKPKSNNAFSIQMNEAINVIGVTMRKYQQIEQIVKNTQQLCSYGNAFIDIREVVEDGNN